ncbi:MAG TPA: mechanosensitive ion channel family protein [Thioalkalivibrio sp.]|mgnify:CR=1 FL=1|nr:mechanosensitive ion channel family protein [Thioalkalivibrio sp.]
MSDLISSLKTLIETYGLGGWITQVFVVVLAVVVFNFVSAWVLARLQRKAERSEPVWDEAMIRAVKLPLNLLIWVVGIAFAAEIVHAATEAPLFEAVGPIRDALVIVLITWFLVRLVGETEASVIERRTRLGKEIDHTTVKAIAKLLRLSVVITGALVGLQTLGFSVSGVLAFGGIGGIAVGFAARDLLANFFGGLMVYLDRPFAVGDWIRSPDKDIEGTVEDIGWRLTRIRRFDKRPLYVPNAIFTSIAVENPSRMTHRRIYETIGIRYADIGAMDAIVRDVKAMLATHPEIDADQTLIVNFNAFNASSVDFFVYTFTRTTQWVKYHEVKHDVLLRIADIIAGHGAEIAFPTRTLHMPDGLKLAEAPQAAGLPQSE